METFTLPLLPISSDKFSVVHHRITLQLPLLNLMSVLSPHSSSFGEVPLDKCTSVWCISLSSHCQWCHLPVCCGCHSVPSNSPVNLSILYQMSPLQQMQSTNLFSGSIWEVQLRILTEFYIKSYNSAQLNYLIISFYSIHLTVVRKE